MIGLREFSMGAWVGLFVAALFCGVDASAQSPEVKEKNGGETGAVSGTATNVPKIHVESTGDEAHQIGLLLRCPVCQGMPIADSPSGLAQDMMKRVRELLQEGKSRDEILDYFAATYGEKTLLEPKRGGINRFVWIAPGFALLLGLIGFFVYVRRGKVPPDRGAPVSEDDEDEYLRAVREEVGL